MDGAAERRGVFPSAARRQSGIFRKPASRVRRLFGGALRPLRDFTMALFYQGMSMPTPMIMPAQIMTMQV
jgi:hypothetical protein